MRVGRSDACNKEKDKRDGKCYSGTTRRCLIPHHSIIDTSCGLRPAQAICQTESFESSHMALSQYHLPDWSGRTLRSAWMVFFAPRILYADHRANHHSAGDNKPQ